MRLIFLLLFIPINLLQANVNIQMSINPQRPTIDEAFQVTFEIEGEGDEPFISFDPIGVEVIRKSNTSKQVSATIINGRVTSKSFYSITYEMTASKRGVKYLKNIVVSMGDNRYPQRNYRFNVGKSNVVNQDIFLLAVPSKTEAFIGEGVDVDYYLYFSSQVMSAELLEYPQYPKFHKRFRHTKDRIETVKYNGKIYRRSLKYSVRLFPQQTGKLKAGSLKLKIAYRAGGNNPYSFGSFLQKIKTKILKSKKVNITVRQLPIDNVPKDFTGLIGEHDFKLTLNRNKYLVNEVIEAKLEVTGEGALESYDAPKLYQHNYLEEFDTKSNFTVIDPMSAKKTFEFTYLPRSSFSIPEQELTLSIFNPKTKSYERKAIKLPTLIIGGQASASVSSSQTPKKAKKILTNDITVATKAARPLLSPDFNFNINWQNVNIYQRLMWILIGLFVLLVVIEMRARLFKSSSDLHDVYKLIRRGNIRFFDLHNFLNSVSRELSVNEDKLEDQIMNYPVSENIKNYFLKLYRQVEEKEYSDAVDVKIKVEKKYFKTLVKEINKWKMKRASDY